ncbi:hypothetical protein [Streptomyces sp. NPDC058426]|uniref:hypothetical protein n=1 Tax=Streptomyces sp. NPDC058426 TaxID=3346493 RepID=UPI003665DC7E
MTTIDALTEAEIITRYAEGLAFVTEDKPATTLYGIAAQIQEAGDILLEVGGLDIAEGVGAAGVLLQQAAESDTAEEKNLFIRRATPILHQLDDAIDEYRDMC